MFFRKNEKLELMQTTLERLEASQKNTELLIDMLNKSIVPKESSNNTFNTLLVNASNQQVEVTEEEKLNAAKALNLCTVSVCQIVDYNDLYIMEQEYEAILNNLNLENMPKDEALLNILKQILDTISFFRIQEGDKKMIEKEYQHKMKNAIWSAVPNFGMIISVGNPVTMLFSLATQVGIGYMNYRKTKAQNDLDHEKNMWNLQKSAMEQLHGLQRELLDTAWRLADKYSFPDEYRLTHKQILQYNDILMDTDYLRRYERLDSIKENFEAYAPFWYYFGNAANHIYQNYSDESIKKKYKEKAIEHFEKFYEINKSNLLREDSLCASYALEYLDLLDINQDKLKIDSLISIAQKNAGVSWDIIQMCAIAYLKIGNTHKASVLLKRLVNEEYNKVTNAQILSQIYVSNYINDKDEGWKVEYLELTTRVNYRYLFPMPTNEDFSEIELQNAFQLMQRKILLQKYIKFFEQYIESKTVEYNKIIWKHILELDRKFNVSKKENYLDTDDAIEMRNYKFIEVEQNLLSCSEKIINSKNRIIDLANDVVDDFEVLNIIDDKNQIIQNLENNLRNILKNHYSNLETNSNNLDFVVKRAKKIKDYTLNNLLNDFFKLAANDIVKKINKCKNLNEFVFLESKLRNVCLKNDIADPEILIDSGDENKCVSLGRTFNIYILDSESVKEQESIELANILSKDLLSKKQFIDEKINAKGLTSFIRGAGNLELVLSDLNLSISEKNKVVMVIRKIEKKSGLFASSSIGGLVGAATSMMVAPIMLPVFAIGTAFMAAATILSALNPSCVYIFTTDKIIVHDMKQDITEKQSYIGNLSNLDSNLKQIVEQYFLPNILHRTTSKFYAIDILEKNLE